MAIYRRIGLARDGEPVEILSPQTKFVLNLIGIIVGALCTAAITISAVLLPEIGDVVAVVAGAFASIVTTILAGIGIAVKGGDIG